MTVDHFSTATAMIKALREREISAVELTELHIARIQAKDGELNAIPVTTFDRARTEARAADAALAAGDLQALTGLPMTLKESCQVAGLPQTAGLEPFRGYQPATDGQLVKRIMASGPALLGKTNIPEALSDWQADSAIYGRTNNPWDLSRTPGGSTGGGGAALAAGFTPLEVGSDIGGSIRVPAAYCGVYGHRPSQTALPTSGSFPGADLPNPAFLLAVQGPLARSAYDLALGFSVMAGPDIGEDTAWRLDFPAPRAERLADFRVAIVDEMGPVRPSSQMAARLDELATFLGQQGARVERVPLPFDVTDFIEHYVAMLTTLINIAMPREERLAMAEQMRGSDDAFARASAAGLTMDATEYLGAAMHREAIKAAWRSFFNDWDIVLAPTALDSAFPHQSGPQDQRTLLLDNVAVPYMNNIWFPSLAIYTGQPATAFPAGQDAQGLPLGLQAIGPYLEDLTTLRFAQLLEDAWHRFTPPPSFT